MPQQRNTKLWSVKLNTNCSRTVVSLSVCVPSYIYMFTVIREMFKMLCRKYLKGTEKCRKKNKFEGSLWNLLKIALSNKKNIYVRGGYHTIFAMGFLIPTSATATHILCT